MGCSSQKATEIKDVKRKEKEGDLIEPIEEPKEEEKEEIQELDLEQKNLDNIENKNEQLQDKENDNFGMEEEKQEDENKEDENKENENEEDENKENENKEDENKEDENKENENKENENKENENKENENKEDENKENENKEEEKQEEEIKEEEKKGDENQEEINQGNENQEEEIPEDFELNEEENFDEKKISIDYDDKSVEKSNQELGNKNNLERKKNGKRNKNNKNIKKKKPFYIPEIQSSPYHKVKIIINACSFCEEYMMPIWCPKDVYIKFRVEGKWRIDKSYEYTDSKGMPSNHGAGFNYGALVGRIGLGDKFVVVDEGAVFVKKEGPLFLRQNLPKKMKIEPEGKLEVTVYDGEHMNIEEINSKIGWIENGIVDNNKNDENNNNENINNNKKNNNNIEEENKELEKKLRAYFNNLRMNPSMFYEKYINFNQSLIWTKEYLEKIEKIEKEPLIENENFYDFLDEYFNLPNQKELIKNINKNNISEYLSKMNEDIGYFLCNQSDKTIKVKSKITQKDNPNEVIIQFLLDKKYRPYLFSSHSTSLTIKIIKNFFNKSTLVVLAIEIEKDIYQDEF